MFSTVSDAEPESGVLDVLYKLRGLGYHECLKDVPARGGFDKVLVGLTCIKASYNRDTHRTVSNVLVVEVHLRYEEFVDCAPTLRPKLLAQYLNDEVRRGANSLLSPSGLDPTPIVSAHRLFLRTQRLI
jgi:hypothetical protein